MLSSAEERFEYLIAYYKLRSCLQSTIQSDIWHQAGTQQQKTIIDNSFDSYKPIRCYQKSKANESDVLLC